MDSQGRIVNVPPDMTDAEARALGLNLIPAALLHQLKRASKAKRRAWYRAQRGMDLSQAPEDVAMRAAERSVERNKRKAERRAARG